MRGKQQGGGSGHGAAKMSDQVAGISTDLFSGVIEPNLRAETFHFSLQTNCNVAFPARETVDLDQFDKEVFKSVLIDQNANLPPGVRNSYACGVELYRRSLDAGHCAIVRGAMPLPPWYFVALRVALPEVAVSDERVRKNS